MVPTYLRFGASGPHLAAMTLDGTSPIMPEPEATFDSTWLDFSLEDAIPPFIDDFPFLNPYSSNELTFSALEGLDSWISSCDNLNWDIIGPYHVNDGLDGDGPQYRTVAHRTERQNERARFMSEGPLSTSEGGHILEGLDRGQFLCGRGARSPYTNPLTEDRGTGILVSHHSSFPAQYSDLLSFDPSCLTLANCSSVQDNIRKDNQDVFSILSNEQTEHQSEVCARSLMCFGAPSDIKARFLLLRFCPNDANRFP
jgi:hypothetical protein